jgi:hypothetical protein
MREDLLKQVQDVTEDLVAKSKENMKQEVARAQAYQKGYEEGCVRLGKQIQSLIKDDEQ